MSRNYAGELLSVTQAAEALGKPTRTVHRLIESGKLAATKLGAGTSAYVIQGAEIDRVLAEAAEATA